MSSEKPEVFTIWTCLYGVTLLRHPRSDWKVKLECMCWWLLDALERTGYFKSRNEREQSLEFQGLAILEKLKATRHLKKKKKGRVLSKCLFP